MNLTADIAAAGNFLKRVEHGAISFLSGLEGAEQTAAQFVDSPLVQTIVSAYPPAKAVQTVFEAQKALVDEVSALIASGVSLPASLTDVHAKLEAAVAASPKAPEKPAPLPATQPAA